MSIQIHEVRCLRDNYAYLVTSDGKQAIVIDPSEAAPVEAALKAHDLALSAIINTHHHWDHVGGNEALCDAHQGIDVYAHHSDRGRVARQTHDVHHDKAFEVAGMTFRPLHVPGHTLGAIAYVVEDAVFTGDTLFIAGCGRLFEGTPEQMYASMAQLAQLPADTRVFCGHEYTASNLRFAAHAEPDNAAIAEKLIWALTQADAGQSTVPSTIADELRTNPFMRCDEASLQQRYPGASPGAVLGAVRAAKDSF